MWDRETKRWLVFLSLQIKHNPANNNNNNNSGLVDFEMWDPYIEKADKRDLSKDLEAEESLTELRKWGLAHKPPAKNWWAEFGIVTA